MSNEPSMPVQDAVTYALSLITLVTEDADDAELMTKVETFTADLTREELLCVIIAGSSVSLAMMDIISPGDALAVVKALGSNIDALAGYGEGN